MRKRSLFALLVSIAFICATIDVRADGDASYPASTAADPAPAAPDEAAAATDEPAAEPAVDEPVPSAQPAPRKVTRRLEKADAFIAPADWEFDGFVAGGQDQEIRSLYYLNDLIYVNVGTDQGLATGDRISIFKRGKRVRDPQTGKFLGYEVRRAATSQVTDRIGAGNCSLRILQANEAVEIGDLVRRAD